MLQFIDAAYSTAYGMANSMLIRLEYPAVTCLAFFALEIVLPRQRSSLMSYLRGFGFVALSVAINTIVLTVLIAVSGTEQLAGGIAGKQLRQPLAFLDLSPLTNSDQLDLRLLGYALATFGIACVTDFFYYWMHRAQHRFGWLWRFHRVHHSITELNATNSYHHVAEDLFQFVAVTVPMSFLLGVETGPVPWIAIVVVQTHSYFIHSTAKINIGPLRYLFSDNYIHRIHHSTQDHHANRNFATSTPLWDVLFRTAYFPKRGEWPPVGLQDVQEPKTIREFLFSPFRSDRPRSPVESPAVPRSRPLTTRS
jgi:sterol desaturase/sphingolipid hydroxylase (fatty acid hydroxylase superfamily)